VSENIGGPKKPRATFGDVMLGIPSGGRGPDDRGGKRERGPRRDGHGERGGRERRQESQAAPAAPEAAAQGEQKPEAVAQGEQKPEGAEQPQVQAKPPQRREKRERKPQGPLVVVKRASGVVETRGPLGEAPAAEVAPSEEAKPEAAAEAEAPVLEAKPVAPPVVVPKSPLYEEVHEGQSFAEMYEESAKAEPARKHFRLGEKVKGKIFQLGADTAFVSLGGKSEAMIELRELKDDEGILRLGVGDEIEAHVIEMGAHGILLSRQISKGSASMAMLAEARASGIPVEGLVLSVNKGGLEVAVGDVRAFCPVSQIDVRFVEKPDQFVGEKLQFRVTEVRDRNVVLSRRAILEEQQKVLAAETRKNLSQGAVLKGRVTGVRDFGAFVDLGGLEGMIPVSEISHVRVGHPSEVVKVGDEVEVEVLRLEAANPSSPDKSKHKERITLSMRSRQPDPFELAMQEIHEGDKLQGKVVRLQAFGAFVELRPGVDGLIHISALANKRIAHPRDAVKVGDDVEVLVEKLDPKEKRIGLRLVVNGEAMGESHAMAPSAPAAQPESGAEGAQRAPPREHAPRPKVGAVVVGKIDRIEPYGVFVAFPGGKGLVPGSESGTERGTDL